ncbi:PREDICTED: pleckstrin homology domain-containing family A member 4 [Nanorana parkeri]|uniref:pleckstrin homology domain-containing family A member 4 n=1 Tax=Nanorana parkeri TaxID=125878 RepID=UPI000854B673|nr:PREDICTED: pleckstrin homology domain-containing family A member 4 [Nanorana parkeri]
MTEEMERPRSGLSVASSVATTTSVSPGSRPSTRSIKRVHTFGKREYSIKRDPNSPVIIRGWLYKQDSQGLRLWKRRWFVLSDFCLFYYRDSREETVLGSILLPSYEILPASPREVKNRRFSFKAEHPGMRTYYFGADTQEDMNAWIRAMNQSALVVADSKNRTNHGHNLTPQDELYASYEDFSHSEINTVGDDGKSAESLEIAHLSETRSQDESSRDSLPEQDRNGDLEKDSLFSGLRESLTDAIQHYASVLQNGSVPPPTPESTLKNIEFTYSRQEVESKMSLEGKDSIPEDEEWVPFHKEQPSADPLELYQARSPPRPHPNGFECPHDEYSSAVSCSAPSSPATLPTHKYNSEVMDSNWKSRDEKFIQQNENVETRDVRSMSLHPPSPSSATCPSAEKIEYMAQRFVKASRSQSLPPISSEVTRHRIVKRSPPPNLKYASPVHYLDNSHPNAAPTLSSPRKETPLTPSLSPKIQSPKHRAASSEDVFVAVTGSPSLGRITVRSNTPIGRVDILPSEDRVPNSAPVRHNEERASEYYVTSSRTRSHIVKSASRPQTPSDRYDVLPSDDPFAASTLSKGPNRYTRRSQPLGAEDERMVDGGGMNLPSRAHGYPNNRMQIRPNTPSERVIVEEYSSELSLTPSMRRHRSQGPRYSERSLHPLAAFSGRSLGYTPRHLSNMASASYSQLPPLPPVSTRPHMPAGKRMSLGAVPSGPAQYQNRGPYPARAPENSIDVFLTKICGQDKLLVSIEEESAHFKAEKEKLEDTLQLTHHHLEEFQGQEQVIENIWYQQRMLQDDLVYVRAKLCDLSLERDRAWDEYRALEGELHTVRETLERVSQIGHPQDQAAAQRDLWMINDTISGLRFNKPNFNVIPDSSRHPAVMVPHSPVSETQPTYQRSFLHHHSGMNPQGPRDNPSDFDAIPPRPPLPKDHQTGSEGTEESNRGPPSNQNEYRLSEQQEYQTAPQSGASNDAAVLSKDVDAHPMQLSCPVAIPAGQKMTFETKASPPNMPEMGTVRKQRMSAEEQLERMRRHQEAQIHEKPKPGVTTQRQNSQRSTTGPVGGRLRLSSSDTFPTGTSSQQAEKTSAEQRKPALVRVTASFYPSSVPTGKQGNNIRALSLDTAQEDPTYCLVMEPQGESVTSITSHEISPVAKVTPPLRTTSKIVTAACMQMKKDIPDGNHDKERERSGMKTNSALQPNQQRTAEKMKTSASSASPATSPGGFRRLSDESFTTPVEEERERIMNLSYTLATEASERSKIITAQALAEDYDANSDVSSSDETYPWDFIMQDSSSSKTSEAKTCQFKATSNPHQVERTSTNMDGNSAIISDQQSSVGASSPDTAKDRPNKRLLDNLHYENWPGHKHDGSKGHFPANKQDSSAPAKCNGQVAKYDFLIEDIHYNPLNMSKVSDYCKEEREPIRITLLQSSF